MVTKPSLSIDEFLAFVHQEDNLEQMFELINGEIVHVSPSRASHSWVASIIIWAVMSYCKEHDLPPFVSAPDGTYNVLGNVVAPDVAYRTTPFSDDYPEPNPPELVVEVISPTDTKRAVARKRQIYLDAGILYWEVYPADKRVDVYAPGQPMESLGIKDRLDGGEVLPGFMLPVRDVLGA